MLPSVVFVQLNEADRYFIDLFVSEGKIPTFARMMERGLVATTEIRDWDANSPRAWRLISPWIVWPTIYTGMSAERHGIVAFGQDTASLRGKCIWDLLDAAGISTGVFGDLMSFPPRSAGNCKFYVPECLATQPSALPESVEPLQDLCSLGARNYSDRIPTDPLRAITLLAKSLASGHTRAATALKLIKQIPAEIILGSKWVPERAMLLTYLAEDAFLHLYRTHRPRYASIHLNHVAYLQHRFWRVAEPERYDRSLSATDAHYFVTGAKRDVWERKFAKLIERGFAHTDKFLENILAELPENGLLIVATGLGQEPMDPTSKIHNPAVRLTNAETLFESLGIQPAEVLHEMNPDLTVNFYDDRSATEAAVEVSSLKFEGKEPLFDVTQRGAQVFLELRVPPALLSGDYRLIRHRLRTDFEFPWQTLIQLPQTNEQSTAHHHAKGTLLAFTHECKFATRNETTVPITAIAPSLLNVFNISSPDWMSSETPPVFALA